SGGIIVFENGNAPYMGEVRQELGAFPTTGTVWVCGRNESELGNIDGVLLTFRNAHPCIGVGGKQFWQPIRQLALRHAGLPRLAIPVFLRETGLAVRGADDFCVWVTALIAIDVWP